MKLAKQLASVNFLREAIANRIPLNLDDLLHEGAGGRAAALKAAVKAGTATAAAAAASGGGASAGSDGSGKEAGGEGGAAAASAAAKEAEAEATRLAMGDGASCFAFCAINSQGILLSAPTGSLALRVESGFVDVL